MRIDKVEIVSLFGEERPPVLGHPQPQGNPIHLYTEDREKRRYPSLRSPKSGCFEATYLRLKTDDGLTGCYGPIDGPAAVVIHTQLRDFLIGAEVLAGELQWDRLHRSDRHSRHGHYMMAISAVDNAMWDLRGKHYGVPVHQLLGGPTRDRVNAYASVMAVTHQMPELATAAQELCTEGYSALKWFTTYGPGDGMPGLRANIDLAVHLREAVGDRADLMFDAFMSWDRDYARRWLEGVRTVGPAWLEEPYGPDQAQAYRELRACSPVRIAGGEHIYGRWEAHRWLSERFVDVLQPDPEWCGGISESVKICTLASVFDIPVIPHGHLTHASLHLAASQPPWVVPMIEYITNLMPVRHHFELHPPAPVGGAFEVPVQAGFGIEIDEARVRRQQTWGASNRAGVGFAG